MRSSLATWCAIAITSGGLVVVGCVLTPSGFQLLELHFELSETLTPGEEAQVHQLLLPAEVVLKRHQVRVSGRFSGTTSQPERVDVLVTAEAGANGKVYDRFRPKVELRPAVGGFGARFQRLGAAEARSESG